MRDMSQCTFRQVTAFKKKCNMWQGANYCIVQNNPMSNKSNMNSFNLDVVTIYCPQCDNVTYMQLGGTWRTIPVSHPCPCIEYPLISSMRSIL